MCMILGRAFVVLGGLFFVSFSLGCMSLSFGGRTQVVAPESKDAASTDGLQRGNAFISRGQEVTVYYPIPYQSPPNLELDDSDSKRHLQITEQKADHFKVRNSSAFNLDFPWRARGVMTSTVRGPVTSPTAPVTTATMKTQDKITIEPASR